jgi:hypothetical protein
MSAATANAALAYDNGDTLHSVFFKLVHDRYNENYIPLDDSRASDLIAELLPVMAIIIDEFSLFTALDVDLMNRRIQQAKSSVCCIIFIVIYIILYIEVGDGSSQNIYSSR